MILASQWIVAGLLRASLGLAVASVAVAACVRLARPRAPRAEQWAWLIVLAQGVVLVPLSIPVPSGYGLPTTAAPAALPVPSPAGISPASVEATPDRAIDGLGSEPSPRIGPAISHQARPSQAAAATEPIQFPWPVAAIVVWLAGLAALLGIGIVRHVSFIHRIRDAPPASPEWQDEWRRILGEEAVGAAIPLVVSREVGPALCRSAAGYRLVVPESLWAGLSPCERAAILRHELAHFRRGDLWTTLLARGLAVLHWFNPIAWWASARFEEQSEFACDRAAMPDDPAAFGAILLRLGSAGRDRVAVVRPARAGDLFDRIQRLLADVPRSSALRCALPIAVAVVALGVTAVRPRAVGESSLMDEARVGTTGAPASGPPLAPRALVHLGTTELRTRTWIIDIAYSPDGRLIAAAEPNTESPRISVYDVRSGGRFKLIAADVTPKG